VFLGLPAAAAGASWTCFRIGQRLIPVIVIIGMPPRFPAHH
jgi:hypothetical protein